MLADKLKHVQTNAKLKFVKGYPVYTFDFNDAPRTCIKCGKKYKPKAPNQKYCPKCKYKMSKSMGVFDVGK